MAWICLAEWEESLRQLAPGSEPSPTVSTIPQARVFYCPECNAVRLTEHPFGTTCKACEAITSEVTSILSPAVSPARALVLSELERVWRIADQAYFSKSYGSLAIFDPDTYSWRTVQLSLFGGLTEFSWSSLRWGTIVDGRLYQPQKWEPATFENDGSYLPTPTASMAGTNGKQWDEREQAWVNGTPSLYMMASQGILPGHPKGALNPEWVEQAMGYSVGATDLPDWAMAWIDSQREKLSCVSLA